MSSMEKYRAESEKVEATITLPVSVDMKSRLRAAKEGQVDVNRWLRDLIKTHLHEIESLSQSSR